MDDEIDLRPYLSVLWRRRYMIGLVTLVAVILAGILSFILPPTYEAKAMVLVTKSSYQIGGPDSGTSGLKIGTVLVLELPTETLVVFAKSDAVMRRLQDRFSARSGAGGRIAEELTVQALRNTNLVELRVRGGDPTRVAAISNEWAALVTRESETLFSDQAKQSYAFFDSRFGAAQKGLATAEEGLRRFDAASNLGVVEARLNATTNQIAAFQSRLTDLSVALQRSETELAFVEAQMRQQPKTLTLSRSITTDPLLQQAAGKVADRDFIELSRLKVASEEINPTYVSLDQDRADLVVKVAALKAERAGVVRALVQLGDELRNLRSQLASQRLLKAQLTRALDNAKQVHDVFLQRREESRLATTAQTGSARLVGAAVVPDSPVAPRRTAKMMVAAFVGLIAGSILAFVLEHYGVTVATLESPQSLSATTPHSEA